VSLFSPNHELFSGIEEADTILDIGAGIKPVQMIHPTFHVCIEPCPIYADILKAHGYAVIEKPAIEVSFPIVDSIFLLDVIEHMEKPEGIEVLEKAKQAVRKQVIVFTPNGFLEQTSDEWGLGSPYWQTHRSGWKVSDFSGWEIRSNRSSIFAIWSAS